MRGASIDPNDLYMLSDPFGRQIDAATVAALFHFLLDHLLTVDLKLGLVIGEIARFLKRRFPVRLTYLFRGRFVHGIRREL